MSTNKQRYTREAVAEKYGTPFTGAQAGRSILASAVHSYLDLQENGRHTCVLYSPDTVKAVLSTVTTQAEDNMYRRYYNTAEWLSRYGTVADQSTDTAKWLLACQAEIFDYTLGMERAEAAIRATADGGKILRQNASLFSTTDLARFKNNNEEAQALVTAWKETKQLIRTAQAYNRAVELLASETRMPELKALRRDYRQQLKDQMTRINKLLGSLQKISEKEYAGDADALNLRLRTVTFFRGMYANSEEPIGDGPIDIVKQGIKGLDIFDPAKYVNTSAILPTLAR